MIAAAGPDLLEAAFAAGRSPDAGQKEMEPIDQLDAADRGFPESRVSRVA
jgi:hypothetical protein